MNNNRDYNSIVYNFSQKFYELRGKNRKDTKFKIKERENTHKKKSFKEISDEIYEFTNHTVAISHTQLAKYHRLSSDPEEYKEINPSMKTVIAIADYYNVSIEYMLGLSNTKKYSDKYKIGSEAFGLSDESMEVLEDLNNHPHIFNVCSNEDNIYKKYSGADLANFILDNFVYEFQYYFNKYFYEVQRLELLEQISPLEINNAKEWIEELERTKTIVKYRKYMIGQFVDSFVDLLCAEVSKTDIEKEID